MTRFSSRLAPELDRFLVFKRALGHPYRRGEFTLRTFDRYVGEHAPDRGPIPMEELIQGWLSRLEGRKPVTVATDLGVLRQFCLFRRRSDPRAFVPPRGWAPQSTQSQFLPHIFSEDDIRTLLRGAEALRGPAMRGQTIRLLILILYCTGLRFGEAVRLRTRDVQLDEDLFVVRESKGKTRLVPFRPDLRRELLAYAEVREAIAGAAPDRAFLVQPDGRPYASQKASYTVRCLLRRTGLKPAKGRTGPRPYDLRHTFAVHRLTQWYRAGVDVDARLPWLSAYMGHDNLLGTEVYLQATPDLLAITARRFEARVRAGEPSS
jgi:integrase/recombinase XerD